MLLPEDTTPRVQAQPSAILLRMQGWWIGSSTSSRSVNPGPRFDPKSESALPCEKGAWRNNTI
jgi:hypothetical protein